MKIITCSLLLFLNVFIVNAQSPKFEWGKGTTGSFTAAGSSIAIDASGNSYTIGTFYDRVDFDPGADSFFLQSNLGYDIFILKLDVSGHFVWAKRIGGPAVDVGISITLDASGNIYTTGQFGGTVDFDPGPAAFNLTSDLNILRDIFISKLDADGNFLWAKKIGANGGDEGNSIKIDKKGNVFVAGHFNRTVDFDPGPGTFDLIGNEFKGDAFVLKLDVSGNFVWAKNFGGLGDDNVESMSLDAFGNVYTIGSFMDTTDFNPGAGEFKLISEGKSDVFISKLDSLGNFVWAKQFGGLEAEIGYSLSHDPSGNIIATGRFQGTIDFDPGPGTFNLTSAGLDDIFILKLGALGNFLWAKRIGSTSNDYGTSVANDAFGNAYIACNFNSTVDFDPGSSTFNLTSKGRRDIGILKLDPSGNFIWAVSMGGTLDDYPKCIVLTPSGALYVTGEYSGSVDIDPGSGITNLKGHKDGDVFVLKMSESPSGINKKIESNKFSIYPSPVTDVLNIKSEEINSSGNQIQILNSTGQMLIDKIVFDKHSTLNIQNLSTGLYLVIIKNNNQIVATQKIVKQ